MKYNCLGNAFSIECLVSMVWNKEPKALKAAERTCDRKRGIGDVRPV